MVDELGTEIEELSRIVTDLANLMTRLLEARGSALAVEAQELTDRARATHHRIQSYRYPEPQQDRARPVTPPGGPPRPR